MSEVVMVRRRGRCARHGLAILTGLCIGLLAFCATAALAEEANLGALTLQDCLRIAFQNSPRVATSRLAIVGAQAQLRGAKSSYYPQLSVSAAQGTVGSAGSSGEESEWRNEADVNLSATLWSSGRTESVRQSNWQLQVAQVNQVDTLQGLVQQVTVDYYKVLASKELVGVAEAGFDSAQQHLHEVQTLIKYGKTAEVDIYAAEDDLARAELDLINARSGVQSALSGLKFTLGVAYTTELDVVPAEAGPSETVPTLEEAVGLAMRERPDVRADRMTLEIRRLGLTRAKIGRGPTVQVGGRFAQPYSDWDAGGRSWNVLANVSWPLYDGGAARADVTSAQAALERAEVDHQQLANQVALDIQSALIEIERASESMKAAEKSVAAAAARLRAAEAKFSSGVGILLEVTDARRSLTSAAASQVRAGFDYRVALIGLRRATGVLPLPEAGAGAPSRATP